MATNAIIGHGTRVYVGYDTNSPMSSPAPYVEIQECTEVAPPNAQTDDVDVTHYMSPGGYREFIPGLTDLGDATVTMNRVAGSSTEQMLMALQTNRARTNVRFVWPEQRSEWIFVGHVKGYDASEAPVDGVMRATVTFKVDSQMTITIPSPAP
jgi:hypothetical protein